MERPRIRRRDKLAPNPDVRRAILAAALKSIREQGVRGLSIAAVLDHAQLSTRAFYRHFESKDQLIAAVFLDMAHREMLRLRKKMTTAATAVDAEVAWIDGQLDRGLEHGEFHDIDPITDAQSIHGVVWACTERQWATGECERADVRERALRFCLRGLGVTAETISQSAYPNP